MAIDLIDQIVDGDGHGIRVTLKNGEHWSGDYFHPDNEACCPPGLIRIDPYRTRTVDPQPAVFIDIEQIASVSLIKL